MNRLLLPFTSESRHWCARWRCLWIITSVLLLLYCSFLAIKRGISDVIYVAARTSINSWTKTRKLPKNMAEFRRVESRLLDALTLEQNNPFIHDDLGRLYSMATNFRMLSWQERRNYGWKAIEHFRLALRYRPTYPYTWANLLLIKSWMAQIGDKEFSFAVKNIIHYGPWEPKLWKVLISVGNMHGDYMKTVHRRELSTVVARYYSVDAKQLMNMVKNMKDRNLICELLHDNDIEDVACDALSRGMQ